MSKEKINSLKMNLKQFGFNEPFTKDNYNIISHLLNDFIKSQSENIALKEEIKLLTQKNKILLESDNIKNKFSEQIKILNDDKKKLLLQIKELKEELNERNKDKNLMELNDEKNKNYIDFIKIENNNLKEDEKKYKKIISDLSNQISLLKEEKNKNINLSQKNEEFIEKNKIFEEKIQTLETNLKELNDEKDQINKLLKEKNKEIRDGENNNILLRKDLDIMNNKLKETTEENSGIKKINKNLLEEKKDIENNLSNIKKAYEELLTKSGNLENENKLILAENENIKYINLVNEKKIYMANCEIQELDKTVKYLKKNLEQIKLTNTNYLMNNKRTFCCQCGCEVNDNNYQEYDINKLLEDNKALYRNNKELKNKLEKVMKNLNSTNANNEAN
jgi:hypothetical protein